MAPAHLISGLVWETGAHFQVTLNLRNSPDHPQGWENILMVSDSASIWFPERYRGTSGGPCQPLSIAKNWDGQSSLPFGDSVTDIHKTHKPYKKLIVQ